VATRGPAMSGTSPPGAERQFREPGSHLAGSTGWKRKPAGTGSTWATWATSWRWRIAPPLGEVDRLP